MLLIMAMVGVLGYPLAGRLADRIGFRRVALGGNLLFAVAVASLSLLSGAGGRAWALFGFLGIAACFSSSVMFNKPVSLLDSKRQALLFAITASGMNLGFVLLPMLATSLVPVHGWRAAYVALAVLVLLIGAPGLLLVRPPAKAAGRTLPRPEGAPGLALAEAAKTRVFWLLAVSIGLGAGALSAVTSHIVPLLTDRHISLHGATSVFASIVVFNSTFLLVVSAILDRTQSPRVTGLFLAVSVIGLALLLTAVDIRLLLLAGVLLGIANGAEYGLLPFAVRRYFGPKAFAEIYGAIFGVSVLASGITPVLMDLVFDRTGSYAPAIVGVGAAILFSALLALLLPAAQLQQSPRRVGPLGPPAASAREEQTADIRLSGRSMTSALEA